MNTRQDELRDELVAILGASRELSADTDRQLAEAFLRSLEVHQERQTTEPVPAEFPHQPHYSLKLAGGAWGATLMFLFLLAVLGDLAPIAFVLVSVVLLALLAAVTRAFLFLARYGWQLPHLHVRVVPPAGKPHSRG